MKPGTKSFIEALGLDVIVTGGVEMFRGMIKEHGPSLIKSHIGGIGTNDERLFQMACTYAVLELHVNPDDLIKILEVIKSYSDAKRARIVEIIGKDEQVVTINQPAVDKMNRVIYDRKTSRPIMETVTLTANIQGAKTLKIMAPMAVPQIKIFLESSGATDTMGKKLGLIGKKIYDGGKKIVHNPSIRAGIDSFNDAKDAYERKLSEPTALEKVAGGIMSKLFK